MVKFSGLCKRPNLFMASGAMSVGLTLFSGLLAFGQPIPVNSVNYDQIIKGGTYGNTATGKTVFYNSTGLWLQKGVTVTGVRTNSSGQPIGGGGNIYFEAPKNVVRLDGDVNVNGGGKVTVDAAYLYQSGNIFASNGAVNINVNSATFTPTSSINVPNGVVNINATGVVDIQKNATNTALINSNGDFIPSSTNNFINIHSGLVNNSGIIRADGIDQSGGGTIQLTVSGAINLQPVADALYCTKVFTPAEAHAAFSSIRQLAAQFPANTRNAIVNSGEIRADGGTFHVAGSSGQGAGNIIFNATNVINNSTGAIHAIGGDGDEAGGAGGKITVNSQYFTNSGSIAANGGNGTATFNTVGGTGGQVNISTQHFLNEKSGLISANGGNGFIENLGTGGIGGTLTLHSALNLTSNQNLGSLQAKGGNGDPTSTGRGGDGGTISEHNIYNMPGSSENVSGGSGSTPGKPGTLTVDFSP